MRRALNVLQACHAAYDNIAESEVYACTGNPLPADIETVVNSMLVEEFLTSYNRMPSLIYVMCVYTANWYHAK
jgi:replication factor C subunit 3/5